MAIRLVNIQTPLQSLSSSSRIAPRINGENDSAVITDNMWIVDDPFWQLGRVVNTFLNKDSCGNERIVWIDQVDRRYNQFDNRVYQGDSSGCGRKET